jgi:hypothetical protein
MGGFGTNAIVKQPSANTKAALRWLIAHRDRIVQERSLRSTESLRTSVFPKSHGGFLFLFVRPMIDIDGFKWIPDYSAFLEISVDD